MLLLGFAPVEDGAAIVICTHAVLCALALERRCHCDLLSGVARVRVTDSAAVVTCTQVRRSCAFGMALPLQFTGNVWTVCALEMVLRL